MEKKREWSLKLSKLAEKGSLTEADALGALEAAAEAANEALPNQVEKCQTDAKCLEKAQTDRDVVVLAYLNSLKKSLEQTGPYFEQVAKDTVKEAADVRKKAQELQNATEAINLLTKLVGLATTLATAFGVPGVMVTPLAAARRFLQVSLPPLDDRVPIPPKDQMNINLSSARESTMLDKFGEPGPLTKDCSDPTGDFARLIKYGVDVGPFKVDGLGYAVESLRQIFQEVQRDLPQVFTEVKTEGVLCVRHMHNNPSLYSNHSWGTAIDLYFGKGVVDQGVHLTHRGNLLLAPYFNKYGWYWGAEFSGSSVDTMHFELAEETILKLPESGG